MASTGCGRSPSRCCRIRPRSSRTRAARGGRPRSPSSLSHSAGTCRTPADHAVLQEVPMTLGYDKPLYLMAFDHRGSFEKDLFGASEPLPPDVRDGIIGVKQIIFDAHRQALLAGAPREYCGVLVDEEFGAGVARRAKEEGVVLAMPVERSGQEEFEFQYGEDF